MFIILGFRDSSGSSNEKRVYNTISRVRKIVATNSGSLNSIYFTHSLISIEYMQSLTIRKVLRTILKIVFAREHVIHWSIA